MQERVTISPGRGIHERRWINICNERRVPESTEACCWLRFTPDYRVANREVARIMASRLERFYAFAFVHAERDRGSVGRLIKESLANGRFVGIKVHRHDARITREICEVAKAFALPVLYDIMGEVSVVELFATEYP